MLIKLFQNYEHLRLGLPAQAAQLPFELKQCTMTISDLCIIIRTQRHYSEQDGHDEQVIVVKQTCKCKTIAFRVMVCLWISRVIVLLQLGYLHNQLSGLAILCFPLVCCSFFFITIGSLPYIASCLCATTVSMHVFFVLLDWVWLRADRANNSFSQFIAVEGHRSLFMFTLLL